MYYQCDARHSLLAEHLCRCLLEVGPALVVELLLRVGGSSLGLCVLHRRLVGSWSLLHAHHGAATLDSTSIALRSSHSCVHARVYSGLSRDSTLLGHLALIFGFLANDIHHTVLEGLLVLGQTVLFPGEVHDLGVLIIALHALIKQTYAVLVVRVLLKLQ